MQRSIAISQPRSHVFKQIQFLDTTTSATVNGHTTSYNWAGSGTTSSNIATGLAQAINQDGSAVVNAIASGSMVSLVSLTTGPSTNYSLSTSTTTQDNSFSSSPSGSALTGGSSGPVQYDTGTASVTAGSFTATANYGSGSTAASIAAALASAFSGSGISATASGTSVSLTTSQTGSAANLPLSATSATSQPGTFSTSFAVVASGSSLTGGTDQGTDSMSSPTITLYGYDALNNLVCVVQNTVTSTFVPTLANCQTASAGWRPRWFQYDSLSHLVASHNPETGNIGYSYDLNGNVASKTDARSITMNYSYDQLNRLTHKTYTDGTQPVTYGYDGVAGQFNCLPSLAPTNPIDKRTSMCDAAGTESWSYPMTVNVGWQTIDQRTTNGVTETIATQDNLDSAVASITYPSGRTINYTYNGAARPLSAIDNTNQINYVTNAAYTAFGSVSGLTNGGSITVSNTYNPRMQPGTVSATNSQGGQIIALTYDFHLGRDNGNVYQIANGRDATRTQNFSYDPLNRIAEAWTSGPNWGESFTIDAWGNLTNRNPIPGKTNYEPLSAPATTNNQLTGFGYDASGDMTQNGGISYAYDAEGRLVSTSGVNYTYDGDGDRVMKSNGTIYWGLGPLAESDASGNIQREYVFFDHERVARLDIADNSVHYYFSNHLGSTSVVTNSSGTAPFDEDLDYYPYGGEVAGSAENVPQNYKFTGKERDSESALDNFGARYDASSLGRFMTPDWAERPTAVPYANFGNPQSLNLYTYVENNPTTLGDPDGHVPLGFGGGGGCSGTEEQCQKNQQLAMKEAWAVQNRPMVVHNADGTTTTTLHSKTFSKTTDSNGNLILTTTYTTTVQTLNVRGEIQETTSYSEIDTASIDANGKFNFALSTNKTSVDSSDPLAQSMQAAGKGPLQQSAKDWLKDIPVAGKFLKRAADAFGIDFTYQDVVDTAGAVAPYYCPSPTGCGPRQ